MPKEETLQKIDSEIADGKLGIARDRLRGLLSEYPTDLTLRSKLGEVNWKLGYPIEAGRFWFLEIEPDVLQQGAIDQFIKSCKGDRQTVLKRIGVPSSIADGVEMKALQECAVYARKWLAEGDPRIEKITKSAKQADFFAIGCIAGLILVIVAVINLIVDLVNWARG